MSDEQEPQQPAAPFPEARADWPENLCQAARAEAERLGFSPHSFAVRLALIRPDPSWQVQRLRDARNGIRRADDDQVDPANLNEEFNKAILEAEDQDAEDLRRADESIASVMAEREVRQRQRENRERLEAMRAEAEKRKPIYVRRRPDSDDDEGGPIIAPSQPYNNAQKLVGDSYTQDGHRTLRHHRKTHYHYRTGAYHEVSDDGIRSETYSWLSRCRQRTPKGELEYVTPDRKMVGNHVEAITSFVYLPEHVEPPAWLGGITGPAPEEILSCSNVLLHLQTMAAMPHTPALFSLNVLPYAYDPDAPAPKKWLAFLKQLWPEDAQSVETLQEFFGLCLTDITKFQKMLLLLGPRRSGKGTIARIMRALVGVHNCSGPTLSQLPKEFGLQSLIGKRVAIISDARLGKKTDPDEIVERLLAISGEDAIDVGRKFKSHWQGQLRVRFVIISNEIPKLQDAAGALAGRFIVLRLTESFYGKEDLSLTDELLEELPGILLWAIEGYQRLMRRGHFVQPESAEDDVDMLETVGSAIKSFGGDRLEAGPLADDCKATLDDLFDTWKAWCEGHGRTHPGTQDSFARDLKTAYPHIKKTRPRADDAGKEKRITTYLGIRIKPIPVETRTGIDLNAAEPQRPYWAR